YVRLRPGSRFQFDTVNNESSARSDKAKSAMDLSAESIDQLVKLLGLLQSSERGFTSRLIPAQQFGFGRRPFGDAGEMIIVAAEIE
ncbi:hypothetical protein, partial [Rhizobium leguminosarum]|uniref:hypothetical protein n=1 Tax=Rhizobium leguminosarum TaxID=384 RepID=UPI003F964205